MKLYSTLDSALEVFLRVLLSMDLLPRATSIRER